MNEYRKGIAVDPEARHSFVEMGPKPGMPPWHEQAQPGRFAFPTEKAAFRFAEGHREPGRKVRVVTPDGKRFDL
ncbi:hypothetical protein SEA_JEEVES_76 [Mycobacterium phage Jeeves]|uniref:Uncharacterized protein n=1 Tax=Mycobacterium phage Jeeves TaxID=2652402 RepID=A0A5J6T486_9CAUD|nr:hypothetical protein KNU75_gp033 [Mycobacterium phage Jeeves]QFG04551.1 hypothetical protein SEA_JEEVES_76 [Mycobacterium phage Jeeves]